MLCDTVGNISKDAAQLGLTHSSVSPQMKSSVRDLGVNPCKRIHVTKECMAIGSIVYNFGISLSDTDRSVYENFKLRVAIDKCTLD